MIPRDVTNGKGNATQSTRQSHAGHGLHENKNATKRLSPPPVRLLCYRESSTRLRGGGGGGGGGVIIDNKQWNRNIRKTVVHEASNLSVIYIDLYVRSYCLTRTADKK